MLQAGDRTEHPLTMEPGGEYWLEFEVRGRAAQRAPFMVALVPDGTAYEKVRLVLRGAPGARLRDVRFGPAGILCGHAGSVGQLARPPVTAPVSVDFYGGAANDFAEQNRFLWQYGPRWERHRIRLNAGAQAPPRADLRFVTLHEGQVEIRDIQIRRTR